MRKELTRQQISKYETLLEEALKPLTTTENHMSYVIENISGKIYVARFFVSYRAESYHCEISFKFDNRIESMILDLFPYIPHSGKPYAHGRKICGVSGADSQSVVAQALEIVNKLISISKQ